MRITVDPGLVKGLKSLPPLRAAAAKKSLVKFQTEPRLPSLAFRPFQGRIGYWLIDSGRGDRVMLQKLGEDHFAAVDAGPHDNILREWNR